MNFNISGSSQLQPGGKAPDFNLPGIDGKNLALNDFRDKKALVVIFSCNHCPYVIKQEERMISLGHKYMAQGVGFVLICSNDAVTHPQDSFENMKKRAGDKEYPFPYLHDESQEIAHAYGARVTPHIFLFDAEMALRYSGAIDENTDYPARGENYLSDALDAILAGKPHAIRKSATKAVGCSVKWK